LFVWPGRRAIVASASRLPNTALLTLNPLATVAVFAIFLADRFFLGHWFFSFFLYAANGRFTAAFAGNLLLRPFAFTSALGFYRRSTFALACYDVLATFTGLDDLLFTRLIASYGRVKRLYLAFVCADCSAAELAYDLRFTLKTFIVAFIIAEALVWRVSGAVAYKATAFVFSFVFIFAFVFVAHRILRLRGASFLLTLFEFCGQVISMKYSAFIFAEVCDDAFFAFITAGTVAAALFLEFEYFRFAI